METKKTTKKTTKKDVKKAAKKSTTKNVEKFIIVDSGDIGSGEIYLPSTNDIFSTVESALRYIEEFEDEDTAAKCSICKLLPVGFVRVNRRVTLEKI